MHLPAEPAARIPEEEQRVAAPEVVQAHGPPSSDGSSRLGASAPTASPVSSAGAASVLPTSRSIHSLPGATQLPIVPSGEMSTALGVPLARYAS